MWSAYLDQLVRGRLAGEADADAEAGARTSRLTAVACFVAADAGTLGVATTRTLALATVGGYARNVLSTDSGPEDGYSRLIDEATVPLHGGFNETAALRIYETAALPLFQASAPAVPHRRQCTRESHLRTQIILERGGQQHFTVNALKHTIMPTV